MAAELPGKMKAASPPGNNGLLETGGERCGLGKRRIQKERFHSRNS